MCMILLIQLFVVISILLYCEALIELFRFFCYRLWNISAAAYTKPIRIALVGLAVSLLFIIFQLSTDLNV